MVPKCWSWRVSLLKNEDNRDKEVGLKNKLDVFNLKGMPFILILWSYLVFNVKMPFLLWNDIDRRWQVIFNALKNKVMTAIEIPAFGYPEVRFLAKSPAHRWGQRWQEDYSSLSSKPQGHLCMIWGKWFCLRKMRNNKICPVSQSNHETKMRK